MPGLPSTLTYVRTLSSGKAERPGAGAVPRRRRPRTQKGVIPSQASPSKVSIGSCSGTPGRSPSSGTRQWAKRRSTQDWAMNHGRSGSSQGRWPVSARTARWRKASETRDAGRSAISPASCARPSPSMRSALLFADPVADRGDELRVQGLDRDDAVGEDQQRAVVGVEVAVLAQLSLQLDDHLVLDAGVAFPGEVAVEALAAGEDGEAVAPGAVDLTAALAGGAGLLEADPPLTGGAVGIRP